MSAVSGNVKSLLRLEGLVVLVVAALAFAQMSGDGRLFALLFLVPDLSMLGYLAGPRLGAIAYNAAHSYVGPLLLTGIALSTAPAVMPFALVWAAHIGFDRMLGYGLKYAVGFGATHLGLIGKARKTAAA